MCLKGGSKGKEKGVRDIKFLRGEREGKEDRDREIERQKGKREREEKWRTGVEGNSVFPFQFFLYWFSHIGVSCSESSSLKRDEK